MNKNRILLFLNTLLVFLKKYRNNKTVHETTYYRISDVKTDDAGQTTLIVQMRNKNVVYKFSPKEVLADATLLDGFSKSDIKNITCLAYNSKKTNAKIVSQEYSEKLNGMVFGIQRPGNKEIFKKTTSEISFDKNLILN